MINVFSNKISTKNLYLVTLKQLINVEYIKPTWETKYIMAKKTEYAICRRKHDVFCDIFSKNKYEFLLNTRKGNYGVRNATELEYKEKYTTIEELEERLRLIKEQAEKLQNMNKNKSKIKKLTPFPKKY